MQNQKTVAEPKGVRGTRAVSVSWTVVEPTDGCGTKGGVDLMDGSGTVKTVAEPPMHSPSTQNTPVEPKNGAEPTTIVEPQNLCI